MWFVPRGIFFCVSWDPDLIGLYFPRGTFYVDHILCSTWNKRIVNELFVGINSFHVEHYKILETLLFLYIFSTWNNCV